MELLVAAMHQEQPNKLPSQLAHCVFKPSRRSMGRSTVALIALAAASVLVGVLVIRSGVACPEGSQEVLLESKRIKKESPANVSPVSSCYVNNSLIARDRWLTGGDGYIMIHHVRRAGGTTLCGLLVEDENHPLLKTNCRLARSKVVGTRPQDIYGLQKMQSLSMLEREMERQGGARIVAVEGFELPPWFLDDPERSKRWTIVTSMRDPIDRLVSISRAKCPRNPQECWSAQMDPAIEYPLDNVMTRMYAGGATTTSNSSGLGDPSQAVTEDDLARAILVLEEQYQIILITEWIPEMAPIFKYWFGIEGGSGSQRRGFAGNHSTNATTLGRKKAVMHHVPESNAKVFLKKYYENSETQADEIYNSFAAKHSFDVRLVEHFRERERQRMFDCFLFRSTNLPSGTGENSN